MKTLSLAALLLSCCFLPALVAEEHRFDVVVFGATPAGITAAVGAAREGAKVALLEPQDIVGGIMSSGLSFSDSNQTDRRVLRGLFEEIHLRIEKHYTDKGVTLPYKVAEKNTAPWTYEPQVAEKVFHDLLKEAGVQIFLNQRLVGIDKAQTRIDTLRTETDSFRASVFIDATYEGDLLPKAGVSFVLGREGRAKYGESLAGKQFPKKPVMGVNPRDANGKLLPLMTGETAGDKEAGDRGLMVFSFRLCLTKDPANRVPIAQPKNYDPAQFELVRRYLAAYPRKTPLFDMYPLPGLKVDGNNSIGGMISIGLVGGSNEWCEASYDERTRIWQKHRDYTEGLIWFMGHDPALPQDLRTEMMSYGYAKDELVKWGHFPPVLYVRQGRRMVGEYVVTQRDIREQVTKEDSIGVGSFPIDSHDVQRVPTADGTGFINEGTIFPDRIPGHKIGHAHQLPYRAITPRRAECDNLLVPVALSSTHVAMSSIRVEPTWMVLGQSAGVAAALAVKTKRAVQDLPYTELRPRLIAQGQALDLLPLPALPPAPPKTTSIDPATLPGIVLDDSAAEKQGDWQTSANFRPYVGTGYVHDGDTAKGSASITFRPNIPKAGRYEIRLAYSPHETRATNVPMTITGQQPIIVNQRLPLDPGSPFRTVATLDLPTGLATITLTNKDTDGFVIVDALQLIAR